MTEDEFNQLSVGSLVLVKDVGRYDNSLINNKHERYVLPIEGVVHSIIYDYNVNESAFHTDVILQIILADSSICNFNHIDVRRSVVSKV